MTSPPPEIDVELAALLGPEFLAYACASDEEIVNRRLAGESVLGSEREQVLYQLLGFARQLLDSPNLIQHGSSQVLEAPSDIFARLCVRVEGQEQSLISALRAEAGGELLTFASSDPLMDAVLDLAQDYYPALLLPSPDRSPFDVSPFPFPLGFLTVASPANNAVIAALTGSEPLRELFEDEEIGELSNTRQFMARSGRGSAANASFLATTFLVNAESSAWRQGSLTLDGYLQAVEAEIQAARLIAAGQEANVQVTVGLAPVQIPEDWQLQTPWGRLRAPNQWEKRRAPAETGAVFELDFPMAVYFGIPTTTEAEQRAYESFIAPVREIDPAVDRLRLALVLADVGEQPLALARVWQLIPDPLQLAGFSFGFVQPMGGAVEISAEHDEELTRWFDLVARHHTAELELPARRLLSALTTRAQPEDALVDAMVALESLFGTGRGEISFRLSVALAWLLESDPDARRDRQKEVADLYDKRSRVVHGGHLAFDQAQAASRAASDLALLAFRALFADRPELIADKYRGKTLAVQGAA